MQGTSHVRSLVRLFIGAVLLCLAWVVLTSGQASAAERSAPGQGRADHGHPTHGILDPKGLEKVLTGALGRSPAADQRSAHLPVKPATRHTPPKASANEKA